MPPSDAFLDVIDAVPSDVPTNSTFSGSGLSSWKEMIRNNYPALSAGINPDDGLLDQLASKGIIADYLLDTYTVCNLERICVFLISFNFCILL